MSKIDDMIARLCPDGVEYKALGEIGTVTRGGNISSFPSSKKSPNESMADDLPAGVEFDLLASGGASTVCATTPHAAKRSDAYQSEAQLEEAFMLVKKYHNTNCADKVIVADIMRAVSSSYELRNKRDLIEQFVDSINSSTDVDADWRAYIAEQSQREMAALIAEEQLDAEKTSTFIGRAFRDGEIVDTGTVITDLMKVKPSRFSPDGMLGARRQRIFERLHAFFERFSGVGLEFH